METAFKEGLFSVPEYGNDASSVSETTVHHFVRRLVLRILSAALQSQYNMSGSPWLHNCLRDLDL